MFKYNDQDVSLDQINKAAQASNLSIEEYINKTGIKVTSPDPVKEEGKLITQNNNAAEGANVPSGTTTLDMELALENGSLDLPDPNIQEIELDEVVVTGSLPKEIKYLQQATDELNKKLKTIQDPAEKSIFLQKELGAYNDKERTILNNLLNPEKEFDTQDEALQYLNFKTANVQNTFDRIAQLKQDPVLDVYSKKITEVVSDLEKAKDAYDLADNPALKTKASEDLTRAQKVYLNVFESDQGIYSRNLMTKINSTVEQAEKDFLEQQERVKKYSDQAPIADAFSKNYSLLDNALKSVVTGGEAMVTSTLVPILSLIDPKLGEAEARYIGESRARRNQDKPALLDIDEAKQNKAKMLRWFGETLTDQAFSKVTGVAAYLGPIGRGVATTVAALSEGGGKYADLVYQKSEAKKKLKNLNKAYSTTTDPVLRADMLKEIDYYSKITSYSDSQITAAALTTGIIEGGVTFAASKIGSNISKSLLPKMVGVDKAVTYGALGKVGQAVVDPLIGEPIEEYTIASLSMLSDQAILGVKADWDQITNLDFYLKTVVSAGATSASLGAIGFANAALKTSSTKLEYLSNLGVVKKNSAVIQELSSIPEADITDAQKVQLDMAKFNVANAFAKQGVMDAEVLAGVGNLNETQLKSIYKAYSAQRQLNLQASEVAGIAAGQDRDMLKDAATKSKITDLKNEFDKQQQIIDSTLKESEISTKEGMTPEETYNIKAYNIARGIAKTKNATIDFGLTENEAENTSLNSLINKKNKITEEDTKEFSRILKGNREFLKLPNAKKDAILKHFSKATNVANFLGANGQNIDGISFLNSARVLRTLTDKNVSDLGKKMALNTANHETLHTYTIEKGIAPEQLDAMSQELQYAINEKAESGLISKEDKASIDARIAKYKGTKDFSEEILNLYNDLNATGIINDSDINSAVNLKSFIQSIRSKVFGGTANAVFTKEDGSIDAKLYLRSFNKFIKDKKSSLKNVDSKGKVVSSISDLENEIESLQESYSMQEISDDEYFSKLDALETAIENYEEPVVEVTRAKSDDANKKLSERSDNIQRVYEEGMVNDTREVFNEKTPLPTALENRLLPEFEAYVDTIVKSKFRQETEEAMSIEDAKSILMTEALKAIRSYNPSKNDRLTKWVMPIVKKRIPLIFKNVNQEFMQDVTLSKSIMAEDQYMPVAKELASTSFTKKINKIAPEFVSQEVVAELNSVVESYITSDDVFKKLQYTKEGDSIIIQPEEQKAFKKLVEESFIKEYSKKFKSTVLANKDTYTKFIRSSFELYDITPQSFLNKKIQSWIEPVIDKATGKQKRETTSEAGTYGGAKGNPIFQKKKITKEEWSEYWLATDKGASTRAAIKNRMAELISQELGKDSFLTYLNSNDTRSKFLNQQRMPAIDEIQGLGITLATALDRNPASLDLKYSLGEELTSNASLIEDLRDLSPKMYIDYSSGASISNVVDKYLSKYSEKVRKEISKAIEQALGEVQKQNAFKEQGETQLEYVNKDVFENVVEVLHVPIIAGTKAPILRSGDNPTLIGETQGKLEFSRVVENIKSDKIIENKIAHIENFFKYKGRQMRNIYGTNNELINAFKNEAKKSLSVSDKKLLNKINISKGNSVYVNNKLITTDFNPTAKAKRLSVLDNVALINLQAASHKVNYLNDFIYFKNIYREQGDIMPAVIWLATEMKDMRTSLRLMAEIGFVQEDIDNLENAVWEHVTPASLIARLTISNIISDKLVSESDLINEINKSLIAVIDKDIDTALTDGGRKQTIGKNYNYSKDPFSVRYGETLNEKQLAKIKTVDEMLSSKSSVGEELSSKEVKSMNSTFNEMIELKKGIAASHNISATTAKNLGRGKGKFKFFIPPSAEDFEGLIYAFLSSGKTGEAQMKFFKEKLFDPFADGFAKLNSARQVISRSYKQINKEHKNIRKLLKKETNYGKYTYDSAIRVYMYSRAKHDIPGINETDKKALLKVVKETPGALEYAEKLMAISGLKEKWPKPDESWNATSLQMELSEITEKIGRKQFLTQFSKNKDIIFSSDNLNKIEAAYGSNFREALEDILFRMETGRSRETGSNRIMNTYLNWVRGSVGVTMFLNRRSAVLQQLSNVNFLNWTDNNPLAASKAMFGNPKQYSKDFVYLLNSDYLKERRGGLKVDINEAEIANILDSQTGFKGFVSALLKKGFVFTQFGDSLAIATGGATFYRNRVNTYVKQGMEVAAAEKQAFLDFQESSEKSQQSSRADRISMQQSNSIGRIFLAFQNTPMQYARIVKKATMDLANGRGSKKENVSKILYYGLAQNAIFGTLQSALFAGLFDSPDLDEEEKEEMLDSKTLRVINNVVDGLLRGTGVAGGVLATAKNALMVLARENEKGWKGDKAYVLIELANVSPPVGIKARKTYSVLKSYDYNQKVIKEMGYSINNPALNMAAEGASVLFNLPTDRLLTDVQTLKTASDQDLQTWQNIALALGWNTWNLGIKNKEIEEAKEKTKKKGISEGRSSGRNIGRKTGR